ncbi:MAG: histidine phosphatase family protein [bacterium]|nr:histidine phosphatase family protein [bacterium]
MSKLIIGRHHESEWNKLGLWTGIRDRHLTDYGFKKSEEMGLLIRDIHVDRAFASMQVRSIETLSSMLDIMGEYNVPTEHSATLNERDYGDYTGKSKWDMQKIVGEQKWEEIRRGWDHPIPRGETLKMVYDRSVPYFLEKILPFVLAGENILIVAHGNSCRAMIKYIENISDDKIADVEMSFGAVFIYELDKNGRMVKKEIRQTESVVNA